MKELSIEEKAKAYDDAIDKIKYVMGHGVSPTLNKEDLQDIFPELKESEDERIRKALINQFNDYKRRGENHGFGYSNDKILAWLEKQGKNNMGISEATKQELKDNLHKALEKETPESWNEFLEKQGEKKEIPDVEVVHKELNEYLGNQLEKQGEQKPVFEMITPEESLDIDSDTYNKIVDECIYGEQKPVCGEEQHEKESLSDIENRIINFAMQFHDNRMKPEAEWEDELKMLRDNIKIDPWSKEDESMLNDITHNIHFAETHRKVTGSSAMEKEQVNWLKSLKDRVQPKIEWSERDELMLEESIGFIKSSTYPYAGDTLRGEISKTEAENWLKSLKNRIQSQPEQGWSEEDIRFINHIKNSLITYKIIVMDSDVELANYIEKEINWIKSLISKLQWKPSDEQIGALANACDGKILNLDYLNLLYQDLKKLKG